VAKSSMTLSGADEAGGHRSGTNEADNSRKTMRTVESRYGCSEQVRRPWPLVRKAQRAVLVQQVCR
jgi:hypothetical protein